MVYFFFFPQRGLDEDYKLETEIICSNLLPKFNLVARNLKYTLDYASDITLLEGPLASIYSFPATD